MSTWMEILARRAHGTAANIERRFDALRAAMRRRRGRKERLCIQPYRSFGTPDRVWIRGRVLEDKGLTPPDESDRLWDNLLAAYKRFQSDEVPGVGVEARLHDVRRRAITDGEGYFDCSLEPATPLPDDRSWHDVALELIAPGPASEDPPRATGQVLIPPPEAGFGVISDVDDTILVTGATNLLRMARLTFLHNARTRLPFKGVAALYRALQAGPRGDADNPLFFVSSSPWNLYDLLVDFCEVHGIPRAPFLLRDFGLDETKFIKSGHHEHKLTQIRRVLDTYPGLPFVLIGDSGQQDPEIYRDAARACPGRITAIYIRDVSAGARDREVDAIAAALEREGVATLRVADSEAAARHAVAHGLIAADAVASIQHEKHYDETAPSDLKQLFDSAT